MSQPCLSPDYTMGEVSDVQLRPALSGKLQDSKLAPASITRKKLHFLVIQKQKGDYCRDILARVQDVNTSNHVKEV